MVAWWQAEGRPCKERDRQVTEWRALCVQRRCTLVTVPYGRGRQRETMQKQGREGHRHNTVTELDTCGDGLPLDRAS